MMKSLIETEIDESNDLFVCLSTFHLKLVSHTKLDDYRYIKDPKQMIR